MAETFDPAEFNMFKEQFDPAEFAASKSMGQPKAGQLEDVAKSAGVGLAKGAIGLAGLPGDLAELGARGIDRATQFIGGQLGIPVEPRADQAPTYGSSDIQRGIEGYTGEFYKPQTTAGEYAQTIGEFAPGIIGGPTSLGARALTRVVAPAVVSETAGQLTHGTQAEPYARIAGALAGGAGANRLMRPSPAAVPTIDELKAAASANYNHPEVRALQIDPQSVSRAADVIAADISAAGIRSRNAPQTFAALEDLKANPGVPSTIADIESVRKNLNVVAGNFSNPVEASAARKAIRALDDYTHNIPAGDVISGNAQRAAEIMNLARADRAAAYRLERIEGAEYRGELNAGSANSGNNINNATRQAIKSILLNPKKRRGFSPEEIEQMELVVKGTKTANALRKVGNLLGGGGGMGQLIAGGVGAAAGSQQGVEGATIGGLTLPILGILARSRAAAATRTQIAKLGRMMAERSPLHQSNVSPVVQSGTGRDAFMNALMAARSARENQNVGD